MVQNAVPECDIFRAAVRLSSEKRVAFLDAACEGNQILRSDVEALLQAHEADGSFLDSPAVPVTTDKLVYERQGTIIGPYKLREKIGEGGFGVVFVAEQEHPIRRKVALKIIKPGMDTNDVIARFEAERQALALMDHPNVARVLDAGATESGRPYFVMELVHGVPITEFCDRNKLPTRQRLSLFADVCRAVQHAHQKGIIHRDLKPSNIMVTLHDGKPVAKVIDFGVSKALSQQLTEKSIYTAYGQMIGTPSYMSPEQAEMSGLGIDTRSDIYSLGVLLYELLTGQAPLDAKRLRSSAYAEILRIIKEEEPPRPSLKISTLGEEATVIAQHRHTDPKQLRRDLDGELDWIVMRCLEKDRARRYETANGLARDIERYLNDEPVEACPPALVYRLKKLARKHRGLLMTAASFAALLVMGSVISTALAAWALRAQRTAELALNNERIALQEAVAAKEKSDQAAQRLRMATQATNDGIAYSMRSNWAAAHDCFTKAAEIEPGLYPTYLHRGSLYTSVGLWDRAAADYARCFELAERADAQTRYEHALLQLFTGNESSYRDVNEELVKQFGGSPELKTRLYVVRACVIGLRPVGEPADLVRKAESLVASASVPWHLGLAGRAYLHAGDYEKAELRSREAIKVGAGSPFGVHRVSYPNLAMALYHQGKNADAANALATAEQAKDEWTKSMFSGPVGKMPLGWADWLEFLLVYRQAKTLIAGSPPPDDPRLTAIYDRALIAATKGDIFTVMDAGRECVQKKEWDRATAKFLQVLDQSAPGFRGSSQDIKFCVEMVHEPQVFDRLIKLRPRDQRLWYARGRMYASTRQWSEASEDYVKAIELSRQEYGESSEVGPLRERAEMRFELAAFYLFLGNVEACDELCREVVQEQGSSQDEVVTEISARTCALSANALTDWSIPLQLGQQAVKLRPRLAWCLFALGIAQHRAGENTQAILTLKRSLDVNPNWIGRGQCHVVLAMAYHQLGRETEARQWLAKSKSWLNETNRSVASWKFGYAVSDYLADWLAAEVLLLEAEKLLSGNSGS
jgi:serine/threonine protein kinase/Flp pilus assembly protein TadD